MDNFLKISKQVLNQLENVKILNLVLGNPSCDLDSAISPITYSYLIHKEIENNGLENEKVIPVLNIPEEDYPLKTEVKYFLDKKGISMKNLTFVDQIKNLINFESCELRIHLTDHHVLTNDWINLKSNVKSVIDHRPQDSNWLWSNIYTNIEPVGCCGTLITKEILKRMPQILTQEIAELLHAVIVLDTINFSEDAQRFTATDIEIVNLLKEKFNITIDDKTIFDELVEARKNISHLTSSQLLHKDLKVIHGNVALPGFPILVSNFIKKSDALTALNDFCNKNKFDVIILMGLVVQNDGSITRDLGVYSQNCKCDIQIRVVNVIKECKELQAKECDTCIPGLVLFAQNNVRMTRKTILPIIEKVFV